MFQILYQWPCNKSLPAVATPPLSSRTNAPAEDPEDQKSPPSSQRSIYILIHYPVWSSHPHTVWGLLPFCFGKDCRTHVCHWVCRSRCSGIPGSRWWHSVLHHAKEFVCGKLRLADMASDPRTHRQLAGRHDFIRSQLLLEEWLVPHGSPQVIHSGSSLDVIDKSTSGIYISCVRLRNVREDVAEMLILVYWSCWLGCWSMNIRLRFPGTQQFNAIHMVRSDVATHFRILKSHWLKQSLLITVVIRCYCTGWGPSFFCVQLVQITTITIVYDTQITLFRWGYKANYNWGAPSCRDP